MSAQRSASVFRSWQLGISMNCNNRIWCQGEQFLGQPFVLGGLWGTITFLRNGTGKAEFTGGNHASEGAGFQTGATHISVMITNWSIGPNATFVIAGGI